MKTVSQPPHAPRATRRARRLPNRSRPPRPSAAHSETDLLILSDGTILAHNLTPEMARVLKQLNELPD